MLIPLAIGLLTSAVCVSVQTFSVVLAVRRLKRMRARNRWRPFGTILGESGILSALLVMLLLGHMVQIAIWACLFMLVGAFQAFETAFYFSAVNFSTLGYGDIVMGPDWRLLGAIEAADGVLMFGLSAAVCFAVMSRTLDERGHLRDPKNPDAVRGSD